MSRSFEFSCPLPHGLHARPATSLAEFCEPFDAHITIRNTRTGATAAASSVLATISADIRHGDVCEVTLLGDDEEAALAALKTWVETQLPHCDDKLDLEEESPSGGEVPRSLAGLNPRVLNGQGVGSGVGMGEALVLSGPQVPADLLERPGEGFEQEWRKISAARAVVVRQMEADLSATSAAEASILQAHLAILQDEEYSKRLRDAAQEPGKKPSAAKIVMVVVGHFDALLGETGNPYLRERALDIQDVSLRLIREIYGDAAQAAAPALATDSVVVADKLTPGDFITLNGPHLKGLVLESSGRTSHTVLLARAAGVPVLLGATGAGGFAKTCGGMLILDAGAGLLLGGADEAVRNYYSKEQVKLEAIESKHKAFASREAITGDGVRLEVAANIALPEEAESVFDTGAEGIGVFRTEMLFAGRDEPPAEQEQYEAYRHVAESANGRPVTIRTFDIGGDKPVPWLKAETEDNPFLGVRGMRLYASTEEILRTQLRAMLRAAAHGNVRIMLPMISTPDELRWARAVYDEVRDELAASNTGTGQAQFGIMIEVPSAVYSIDKLAPLSDFFSIGSNDLTQYFMAADRGNERLKDLYSSFQPSFLRLLKKTVDEARAHGVHTALCGDMASDERALPLLVGLGLDEISLVAPQIPRTKTLLAELDADACRNLLETVAGRDGIEGVHADLEKFRGEQMAKPLFSQDLVVFTEDQDDKVGAIKRLVDLAHTGGRTSRAAALEGAIWQREDQFSTGLGFGIAIPHCKSAAVGHNSLCVARYAEPLDWQSRDGQPVDTVIMLIMREGDAGEAHMRVFAKLARSIMHEEFRDGLRACPDPESLLRYIEDAVEE